MKISATGLRRLAFRRGWFVVFVLVLCRAIVYSATETAVPASSAQQNAERVDDRWEYRPIRQPAVPQDGFDTAGVRNPIDAFIRRKLRQTGLTPAGAAARRTLIRRLTFDLTGLPPSVRDVDAFVQDRSDDAYPRLVNRLLDSRAYGIQMARHWLDVVRYADTGGFSNDFERPNAWRYRDYVIRSFNRDKPFDRFIIEQLAGDELDPSDPDCLIAVGYLRMGPWEQTGMSVAAVTRQQFLDDITASVGSTFLAQGLRCCQCHDHKFDPIPTRDYYRVQAVFAPVQFADRRVPYQAHENISSFDRTRPRAERLLRDARKVVADLRRKHKDASALFLKRRGVRSLKDVPRAERPQRHYGLTPLELSLQKIYGKRVAYYEREMKRYQPLAFSVYSGPDRPFTSVRAIQLMPPPKQRIGPVPVTYVLEAGSLSSRGEKVTPGVLSAVADSNDAVAKTAWNSIPTSLHGRRLALARWIASPRNTLTARVIVNRIWQQHFGTGIVATPNDFGKKGRKPTHPELLDWLARWFVQHGWSIKKLHRLMVTSATYRQSGHHPNAAAVRKIDPDNHLLARFPPRRLAAEEIHDALLAVTGELNPETGGPGVYPEINWEVALQPRQIMGSAAPAYQPSPRRRDRHRRAIYAFRYRNLSDPLLAVFDSPGSELSCPRRNQTTITPQAFTLFNGGFARDRALALARQLVETTRDANRRVERAFRLIDGRIPTAGETQLCLAHVAEMTRWHRAHKPVVVKPPLTVKRDMIEELTGRKVTWIEQLDRMPDFQPDLKPWDVDGEIRGWAELCLVLMNSNEFLYVR